MPLSSVPTTQSLAVRLMPTLKHWWIRPAEDELPPPSPTDPSCIVFDLSTGEQYAKLQPRDAGYNPLLGCYSFGYSTAHLLFAAPSLC